MGARSKQEQPHNATYSSLKIISLRLKPNRNISIGATLQPHPAICYCHKTFSSASLWFDNKTRSLRTLSKGQKKVIGRIIYMYPVA
jgi:hypothetical protein